MHNSCSVQDGPAPQQHWIILDIQWPEVSKQNLCSYIGANRVLRGPDFQSTSGRGHQCVHLQCCVGIGGEAQLTIHPNPLQCWLQLGGDLNLHFRRDQHTTALRRNPSVFPSVW